MRFKKYIFNSYFIFCFFLIIFLVSALLPRPKGITLTSGDEPHYLVMTYALLHNHSLNNLVELYQKKVYLSWWNGVGLEPHMVSIKGKLYPLHQIGLALFMLPGFFIYGRLGSVFTLICFTSFGLVLLFKTLMYFVDKKIAFLTIMLTGLSVPIGIYSDLIYPEVMAFFFISSSLFMLFNKRFKLNLKYGILFWLSLSFIPVFHIKFLLLLIMILLFLNFRILKKAPFSKIIVFDLFMFLPTLLYIVWLYYFFNGNFFLALNGFSANRGLSLNNIPSGILSILVDREHGILIFSPYYIYFIYQLFSDLAKVSSNFRLLKQKNYQIKFFFFSFVLFFTLLFTMYSDVIGGQDPAGRYLLPTLPAIITILAIGFDEKLKDVLQRIILIFLSIYSVLIFIVLWFKSYLALPSGQGNNIVNFIFGINSHYVNRFLPSFLQFKRIITINDYLKGAIILFMLVIISNLSTRLFKKEINSK